jgi:hypothetical protein
LIARISSSSGLLGVTAEGAIAGADADADADAGGVATIGFRGTTGVAGF